MEEEVYWVANCLGELCGVEILYDSENIILFCEYYIVLTTFNCDGIYCVVLAYSFLGRFYF